MHTITTAAGAPFAPRPGPGKAMGRSRRRSFLVLSDFICPIDSPDDYRPPLPEKEEKKREEMNSQPESEFVLTCGAPGAASAGSV